MTGFLQLFLYFLVIINFTIESDPKTVEMHGLLTGIG
jgi:hypothetical protein